VLEALSEAAPAVRLAGDALAEHAVLLAEHRDEDTGFG
jgi:hypothetical protein